MHRKPAAFGEPWLHSLRNAKASFTFHSFAQALYFTFLSHLSEIGINKLSS